MPKVFPGVDLSRRQLALLASAGAGLVVILMWKRWREKKEEEQPVLQFYDVVNDGPTRMERQESGRAIARMRTTPSLSERGSTQRISIRQRSQLSTSMAPTENDIVYGVENMHELIKILERAYSGLEMIKNRSEKDRNRVEMLSSVVDRLRVIETDLSRLVGEYVNTADLREDVASLSSGTAGYASPRAGTLSVLSDDSFMSAFEEFPVQLDEDDRDLLDINENEMVFYQDGLSAASNNEVKYRKSRTEFCQCESETEFAAKLWCLRQAFDEALRDDHRRLWLANTGRTLLADILKHSKQDPSTFYEAFDSLMEFFNNENNMQQMEQELKARGVVRQGFWDVVLDFILLDSFDDLKNPPSAIYSVTKNYFLSQSMKYSTISTVIWSMLKAKRQRLQYPHGFIAHFYNISEAVMPAITLGFLGTDPRIGELCQYFKEQITQFVLDVFCEKRVRYTSLEELAEDVWVVIQNRAESLQTRMATELIPA